ncbi:rhomboid family intramembrane serine protease [Salinicoccus sp. HZC-1]|uniref:rhomboid family intramembrane serine protease n=1 Tax=Salinicoccus sp. HZC-1 TaxID=3385497 RepID=UPI00398AC9BC
MRSKWHTAYELVRYTGYSFFNYDRNNGTIWLKNPKESSIMCLNDFYLTEEEMNHTSDSLFDSRDMISKHAGFNVNTIHCIHMAESIVRKKRKENGLKIVHRGIADMKQIIRNPFFKMDMEYKKARDDGYYQRRLMGPHPFEKYMIKFTPMTYLLISINLVIFLFNFVAVRFFDSYILTNGLALSHFNVVAGDYYRLLTSSFLHVTIDHFLFNIFALYILGKFTESLYGKFHLLIAYCLTGILSSLFSMMFVIEGISLGASGAVYGLLGIIIVHLLIHGRINAKLLIQIAVIFIVVSVFSQLFANINHFAHIGGLLSGVLLGIIYNPRRFNSKWFFGAFAALIVLSVISYFVMISKDSSQPFDDMALEHIEKGEYEEALNIVNEALRSGNDTATTYHALGILSAHAGDYEQAEKYHDKSYQINPENEQAAKYQLIQLRKQREYDEMGEVLSHLDTQNIKDEGLKLLVKEHSNE